MKNAMTYYEKFSQNFTLEIQFHRKNTAFQCYWWKYQNTDIWLNFQLKLKWKILKHFARTKHWAAFRKLFSPPHQIKASYEKIYRNIQTVAFPVFQGCSCRSSRNDAVQIFLLRPTTNMFAGKSLKCCGIIFFTMLSELRFVKWARFCEGNCIVK